MLGQLQREQHAAALALVWLITGDRAAADTAIARMLAYREPDEYDTFHIHSRLTEFALAYDWLCNYDRFTPEVRAEIRRRVNPTAWQGMRNTYDHIFHNYVWMSAGGASLWALATAGEDQEADLLCREIIARFNEGLYPAWAYLEGLPSEPLGYWFYYVFSPGALTLLAAQSAFEQDLVGRVEREQDGWFSRHFQNMLHSVLPDLRFLPWGDLQGGSNGGATIQFAGIADAVSWALGSTEGAYFSRRIAEKRGLERFYHWHAIFDLLYTRQLETAPPVPPASFLAGGPQGGHFIARSDWSDSATIVAFGCKDHYGDHHHYDQGGFIIYRQGLLAVDPPVYKKVAGPQQPTAVHNTLLIGGQNQRHCRGQWFKSVAEFEENRTGGEQLETGDILFHTEQGEWAAVAGQFAQAYDDSLVASCVRQLLFLRPGTVIVVDHLEASAGKTLPEVQWLLQLPERPSSAAGGLQAGNGRSRLRWQGLTPPSAVRLLEPEETEVNTWRVGAAYPEGMPRRTLVNLLETEGGPGESRLSDRRMKVDSDADSCTVTIDGRSFVFEARAPFRVRAR